MSQVSVGADELEMDDLRHTRAISGQFIPPPPPPTALTAPTLNIPPPSSISGPSGMFIPHQLQHKQPPPFIPRWKGPNAPPPPPMDARSVPLRMGQAAPPPLSMALPFALQMRGPGINKFPLSTTGVPSAIPHNPETSSNVAVGLAPPARKAVVLESKPLVYASAPVRVKKPTQKRTADDDEQQKKKRKKSNKKKGDSASITNKDEDISTVDMDEDGMVKDAIKIKQSFNLPVPVNNSPMFRDLAQVPPMMPPNHMLPPMLDAMVRQQMSFAHIFPGNTVMMQQQQDLHQTPIPTTSGSHVKKKLIRTVGGQIWDDPSLAEWEQNDFRIFCGDLGNDVTDDTLTRAFSVYPSFRRARVVRDKKTHKTRGYGFISMTDPGDFVKAMKEMDGRYVGSRPLKLKRSKWKDRNIDISRKREKEKKKLGLR